MSARPALPAVPSVDAGIVSAVDDVDTAAGDEGGGDGDRDVSAVLQTVVIDQVARRLRAQLDALIADLPEHRRPALEAQSDLLSDAVEHSFRQTQHADALVPDRQGIGMSHREREYTP